MSPILPEVWDSTGCADTCPCHHHYSFELALSDVFCNVLQSLLTNIATASSKQPSYSTTSYEGSSVRSKCLIKVQFTEKFLGFSGIITEEKRKKAILTDSNGIVKEIQHPSVYEEYVTISFDGQGLFLTDLRKSIIVRFSPTTDQKEITALQTNHPKLSYIAHIKNSMLLGSTASLLNLHCFNHVYAKIYFLAQKQ